MNLTERIYAYLLTQGGPRTLDEIARALGADRYAVQCALHNAKRRGRVVPDGWRGWVPGREALTKEEVGQRGREALQAIVEGRESYQQKQKREAQERREAREREAAARRAKREFERAERARNTVTDRAIVANFRKRIEQPAAVPLMTSEEWIARGNKVQRLKPFEVSPASRFKRIKPQERVAA